MLRGGRSLVSSPPAFSNDAKKLLVCTGNTVSIYSTATGLQITELEGHTALVTSVVVVPATMPASNILCFCWTASLDGTIRYWDFSIPESIKTINIRFPIYSMVIPGLLSGSNEKSHDLFAYLCTHTKEQKQNTTLLGQIRKCNLSESRLAGGSILAEIQKPRSITISSNGKYFGVSDKSKLRIWQVPAKEAERVGYKKIRLHHTKKFTALAFHPTQRIVAAGDESGRVLIWRGFGDTTFSACDESTNRGIMKDEDERPGVRYGDDADSCTTWHWHSSEVNILFFSSDGAYLYSGGKEGVLVVWQLDSGKKKFLPRIGSPLLYFMYSADPSLASISCADNRIHLLKMPSMEIFKSISGIKLPRSVPQTYTGSCSDFAFDPAAGVVAICTDNYSIQFFSLFEEQEISEVQVCERNHQPGDEIMLTVMTSSNDPVIVSMSSLDEVLVNVVALSKDGSLMSTVETRLSEEGIGGLVSLKFWECGSQWKVSSLSTVVYEPHREFGVSGITFHPTRRIAVSCSYGGDFKVWVSSHGSQQKDNVRQNTGWTCHAVGSYKKKPMTAAAFSVDGSVLAVAAETFITLWNPEKNVLVAVIGQTLEPIVTLSFIGKSEFLVSASRGLNPQLSVWSMSKLSASFSYKLHVQAVACKVEDTTFAVLALIPKTVGKALSSTNGVILLFSAGDSVPAATWFVNKAEGGGLAFIYATQTQEDSVLDGKPTPPMLAYINSDHEYALFYTHEQGSEHGIPRKKSYGLLEETGQFGYASIYGELPEFNLKQNHDEIVPVLSAPSDRPWETIFSGSSHNLPPLTKLCSVFLESLLERRTTVVE